MLAGEMSHVGDCNPDKAGKQGDYGLSPFFLRLSLPFARSTGARQKHFMPFGNKARRGRLLFIQSAHGQFENLVAASAVKVMVVVPFGFFIKRSQAGMVDLPNPSPFHQEFQVSIDRRLVQRFDELTS
jgi:hypothetical protein